ncbi:MAG: hypothetical protein EOP88_20650 [Verrucomicrobiaceae bacterium]|nr:MAG: hypothetical protein EOP88_20650 [Verrucomicrobiaceae bacterium]
MRLILSAVFVLGLVSCGKSKSGTSAASHSPPAPVPASPFTGKDDATLVDDLQKLCGTSFLEPDSEDARKAEAILTELLTRRSPELYPALDLLAPGLNSTDIIENVFKGVPLTLDEFRQVTGPIKDKRQAGAAMEGAIGRKDDNWRLTIADLEGFLKDGMPEQAFTELMLSGHEDGRYSLEDLARNHSEWQGNLVTSRLYDRIGPERFAEYVLMVYANGRTIGGTELWIAGRSLFESGKVDAEAWARKLPEKEAKAAMDGVYSGQVAADPMTLDQCLDKFVNPVLRDGAILRRVKHEMDNRRPEEAAKWAEKIQRKEAKSNAADILSGKTPGR